MSGETYNVICGERGVPIKAWTKGVQLEDQAKGQLLNVAQLPFVFRWIAAMPDVHWGIGATVGSVIPTKGAIIPAAVGVDIGCGMMAVQTSLNSRDLPENLHAIREAIEKAVPHGRTNHGGAGDKGAWHEISAASGGAWAELKPRYDAIVRSWIVATMSITWARLERETISSKSAWTKARMFGSCSTADRGESGTEWVRISSSWLKMT
jgi:tRNA-splicing ligase RtcB